MERISFPEKIQNYIKGAQIFDRSCSPKAKTWFAQNGQKSVYIKTSDRGMLERESEMTAFLRKADLAPDVLFYETIEDRDYLVTIALEGENGIHPNHLSQPERMAALFGEKLRLLHSISMENCPYQARNDEMIREAALNISIEKFDADIVPEGAGLAARIFDEFKHLVRADGVLHGDYCFPNIILKGFRLSGFVDVGNGGVGDRHYDVFWGIWTLKYNLKTDRFRKHFLAGYGEEDLDERRLDLARILAGFTE